MPPIPTLSNLWEFHDSLHPVYTRPPDATRWPVPLAGTVAARDYLEDDETPTTRELLRLNILGHPSAAVFQEVGTTDTVLALQRRTRFMGQVEPGDRLRIEELARRMWEFCRSLSTGPYTPSALRKMGHPYGWAESWAKGNPAHIGRHMPRQGRMGHPRGVRGSVPTMGVVNYGLGRFYAAWEQSVEWDDRGFRLEIRNTLHDDRGKPTAWFLAHGTIYMQPHGPWRNVLDRFAEELRSAWTSITRQASARASSLAAIVGTDAAEGALIGAMA